MKEALSSSGPSSYYSLRVVCVCLQGLLNELHKHTQAKMTDKDGVIESRQQSSIKGSFSFSTEDTASDSALISLLLLKRVVASPTALHYGNSIAQCLSMSACVFPTVPSLAHRSIIQDG